MHIDSSLFIFINIVVVVIFLVTILLGYKNGFLYGILNIVSLFISAFVAWVVGPVIAERISFFDHYTSLSDVILYTLLNFVIWILIVFFLCRLILFIVMKVTKLVSKLPIIGVFNRMLGALLGVVVGFFYIILLTTVLASPIFVNGQEAIDQTFLKPLSDISNQIILKLSDMIDLSSFETQAVDNLQNSGSNLEEMIAKGDIESLKEIALAYLPNDIGVDELRDMVRAYLPEDINSKAILEDPKVQEAINNLDIDALYTALGTKLDIEAMRDQVEGLLDHE